MVLLKIKVYKCILHDTLFFSYMNYQVIAKFFMINRNGTILFFFFFYFRWVFASNSIQDVIKKHIDERLVSIKPGFICKCKLNLLQYS